MALIPGCVFKFSKKKSEWIPTIGIQTQIEIVNATLILKNSLYLTFKRIFFYIRAHISAVPEDIILESVMSNQLLVRINLPNADLAYP